MATHSLFLPGESHGQRSLVGYSPCGPKESDTFNQNTSTDHFIYFFGHCVRHVGILVPQPGIEPIPPEMEMWHLNHWTTRDVP